MVSEVRPAVVRIETGSGSGSGVIFETQGRTGYIVTNHHVVEGEVRVTVTVNDSATYVGSVLGTDQERDLAVVSICCGSFTALPFGDAAAVQPGDAVVAIGYAWGLDGPATVTRGIVSAVRYEPALLSQVIQTDAAINPGNSGGPMLSLSGKILGINTFGYDKAQTEGLNFAISGTTVQSLVPALQAAPAATPTPTPRATPTPTPGSTGAFGPISGELRHDPSDDLIELEFADVSIADLVVEATFVNPYSAASNDWDYGFMIMRFDPTILQIKVVVTSDRRWYLGWRETSDADDQRLGGGTLRNVNIGAGGRNHLKVVAIDGRGWFFVNGDYVATLDLSDVTGSGYVAVITGAFTGNEIAGAVTRFENFKGEHLRKRYGPAGGKLEKEPGFIATHDSGVSTRDLVVEANFVNPQGSDWDYGFIIRNPEYSRLEVIGLTGDAWWFHDTRDVGDDEYTTQASGFLSAKGINLLSKNHLLVVAIQESGWFFVNGQLVAKLDLGHNLDLGWVSAAGDFFQNHQGSPSFEDFNVWTP